MSENQYARKAMEEVIRLADEKMIEVQEYLIKKNEEFNSFSRGCDDTAKELNIYFNNLVKQLEKWKMAFMQDILESSKRKETEFAKQRSGLEENTRQLRDLRERTGRCVALGTSNNGTDLVYQVHNCLFNINQEVEVVDKFMNDCMSLKFVGKLQLDKLPKEEIGCLEQLVDIQGAEILPIKLPKIKLGQLFNLQFRLSDKHCEAAKKFLTFAITKENQGDQKVGAYLQDNRDGSYSLSFPITAIVPHTVHIKYMSQHIRNSPYTILFKIGTHANGPSSQSMGDHKEIQQGHLTAFQDNNNALTESISVNINVIPRPTSMSTDVNGNNNFSGSDFASEISLCCKDNEDTSSVRSISPLLRPADFNQTRLATTEFKKPVVPIEKKFENLSVNDAIASSTLPFDKKTNDVSLNSLQEHSNMKSNSSFHWSPEQDWSPDSSNSSVINVKEKETPQPNAEKAQTLNLSAKKIAEINNNGLFRCPVGIACNQDLSLIFVCDMLNNEIKVFDSAFTLITQFGSNQLRRPSSAVVLNNCSIVVKDDFSLRLYNRSSEYDNNWSLIETSKHLPPLRVKLYGLVLAKMDLLVTLDERNERLLHFNRFLREIGHHTYGPLKTLGSNRAQSKCRFMDALIDTDKLYCSDLGLNQVYVTTLDGTPLFQFGSTGRDPGLFLEPAGISVLSNGLVLIGDSKNNRIQVFNENGEFKFLLQTDVKSVRMSDILVCEKKKTMFIMNYSQHHIKVYEISGL